MALVTEFVNVIVRKSAVETRFPGGLDAFARQDLPNLAEDDHLLRVGFMSTRDALSFVSRLKIAGLRPTDAGPDSDVAVLSGDDHPVPPWLSVGRVGGRAACWASGFPPGEPAAPEPGFLLRCPRAVYDSLHELVRRCGADLLQPAADADPAPSDAEPGPALRCVRGDAEAIIYVIAPPEAGSPVALWGSRHIARRAESRADAALIRDLASVLTDAGAD